MSSITTSVYTCAALLMSCTPAFSQGCETVIALSKLVSSTIIDEQSFSQETAGFCRDYSQQSSRGGSISAGAKYGGLALSFGKSTASTQEIYDKYCDAQSSTASRQDAYRQYVESIAPGAYPAYQQCKVLEANDLHLALQGAVLPTEFLVTAHFSSTVAGDTSAHILADASDGVTCTWRGSNQETELPTGESTTLRCKRDNAQRTANVTVIRTDRGKDNQLTIPWPSFTEDGLPVNTVRTLETSIADLQNEVASLATVVQARKQDLECRVAAVSSPTHHEHFIQAEARVPDEFPASFVTGGGCRIDVSGGGQTYIGDGFISDDKRGWLCNAEHVPEIAALRTITAQVIFCNLTPPN